jgi:chromosome segregation ATPase
VSLHEAEMEARVDELEAECDALNAENRELRADAERYRIMWERDSTALGKVLADLRTAKAVMEDQRAEVERLREALNTMLDYYGEDEHNKATHDAARAALAKEKA